MGCENMTVPNILQTQRPATLRRFYPYWPKILHSKIRLQLSIYVVFQHYPTKFTDKKKRKNQQQTTNKDFLKQSKNTYKIVHTNMQLKYAIFFGFLKKIVF